MTRIELQVGLQYEVGPEGADFIFNLHAAHTASQTVSNERLLISQAVIPQIHTEASTGTRFTRLRAWPGPLQVNYSVTIDIRHFRMDSALLAEVPVAQLPFETLPYLNPSRYCQSDQFTQLAMQQFGQMRQGHSRVQAIQAWVQQQVKFTSNTSNSNTSAVETLQSRTGVCRDFAHLMIALCRALCIPARFTTGTDFGADPILGPPDFHAYVEVFMSGGWFIFDASGTAIPMGFVRLGTGRDAADVPFASMYGPVVAQAPVIQTHAVVDPSRGLSFPVRCNEALSTDMLRGPAWRA
jgi:transglutaminase-like putative cysteine protease